MTGPAHRPNAFGFLRLCFAALVIVSHTPDLADGNHDREPMIRLFGTSEFGGVAVAGFFIISGYLITGSYLNSRSTGAYLLRRVARLYPAFIAASLLCILVVAPLAGGQLHPNAGFVATALARMLLLQPPVVAGAFAGTAYPDLDGAMWTIAHEFRCYLLVLLLGVTGLLRRRRLIAVLAVLVMLVGALTPPGLAAAVDAGLPHRDLYFGSLGDFCRLTGCFLAGAVHYLYRDRIRYTREGVWLATFVVIAAACSVTTVNIGLAGFGSYVILAVAESQNTGWMRRVNSRDDISYGLYLYAWPSTKLLLLYASGLTVVALGGVTLVLAVLCGIASWHLVERPVTALVRARAAAAAARGEPATDLTPPPSPPPPATSPTMFPRASPLQTPPRP